MQEKLTLQHIADAYAKRTGAPKKTADALSKTFFETITNGLNRDGLVKVNGLGTFKVIDVAERESVNVNNGARIVIAGYKKVTFIPAEGIEISFPAHGESHEQPTGTPATAVQLDVPDTDNVELPPNEFSAIDMLISTPESLNEVRDSYEKARQRAAETLKAANEANAEMLRLEKLVQRLESNTPPQEPTNTPPQPTEQGTETEAPEPTAQEPVDRSEALRHYLNDKPIHDEEEEPSDKGGAKWLYWLLIPILGILLAIGAISIYKYVKTTVSVPEEKVAVPQPKASSKPKPATKSPQPQPATEKTQDQPAKADSTDRQQPAPAAPAHPKTYVMKPGDSLTKIAQRVYGSKDSVRVILRANKFPNPDNIPVGATINLP